MTPRPKNEPPLLNKQKTNGNICIAHSPSGNNTISYTLLHLLNASRPRLRFLATKTIRLLSLKARFTTGKNIKGGALSPTDKSHRNEKHPPQHCEITKNKLGSTGGHKHTELTAPPDSRVVRLLSRFLSLLEDIGMVRALGRNWGARFYRANSPRKFR